ATQTLPFRSSRENSRPSESVNVKSGTGYSTGSDASMDAWRSRPERTGAVLRMAKARNTQPTSAILRRVFMLQRNSCQGASARPGPAPNNSGQYTFLWGRRYSRRRKTRRAAAWNGTYATNRTYG